MTEDGVSLLRGLCETFAFSAFKLFSTRRARSFHRGHRKILPRQSRQSRIFRQVAIVSSIATIGVYSEQLIVNSEQCKAEGSHLLTADC